jgi:taurine dioxygenase
MQTNIREMQITRPSKGAIGAIIESIDVNSLQDDEINVIREAVYAHKLVTIRGQELSREQYVAFARRLGRPQIYFQTHYRHPDFPEIFVSSNVPENGQKVGVSGTGRYWHTDYQFFNEPLPLTMQYPQVVDGIRETFYIDMERVLGELPSNLAGIVWNARALHDGRWRYKIQSSDIDRSLDEIYTELGKQYPGVTHPMVITHPLTGAKSLYVSRGFTVGIVGRGRDEGDSILHELFDFIEQEDHVHTLRWKLGEIALWDNRTLLHMAGTSPPGQSNVTYRIGIYDDLPFYMQ